MSDGKESRELATMPFTRLETLANAIAASRLFGIQTKEQALALMAVAESEGRHPGSVARDYHIIQNRPALKADAMLARFQQAGGKVKWHDYTDTKVSATFTHPQGGSLRVEWDMDRARKAQLGTKDNWVKYPRSMLRARCISEGIRTVYPGVVVGVYTPEEVQDMEPMRDVTPKTIISVTTAGAGGSGTSNGLCILLPGGQAYGYSATWDGLAEMLNELVSKIVNSKKLLPATKADKLRDLAYANEETIGKATDEQRSMLRDEIRAYIGTRSAAEQAEVSGEKPGPERRDNPAGERASGHEAAAGRLDEGVQSGQQHDVSDYVES